MSRAVVVLALGLAAALPAHAAPHAVAVAVAVRKVPAPLPSVRVKGLERFDRVAWLEDWMLCGMRAGQAPVCAAEPHLEAYAAPYEALDDVVQIQALGPGHCILFGTGELRCAHYTARAVATPLTWPILRSDATAFEISATTRDARVYVLDRERTLHVYTLAPAGGRVTTAVAATNVRSFGATSSTGACAAVTGGDVLCSDPQDLDAPLQPTAFHGVATLFDGGAILRTDGTFDYVLDSWAAFAPWPEHGRAYQAGCVLTPRGGLECANTIDPWVKVLLPAAAKRFAPTGDISCAVLVDHTTACYGPFLASIERLAKRARRPPRASAATIATP